MESSQPCKAIRLRRFMTLEDASSASGLPVDLLSRCEDGSHEMTASEIVALSSAYGVSADLLLKGDYECNGQWGIANDVAIWLGIGRSKAYALMSKPVEKGGIPTHTIGGSTMAYRPEVHAWAMAQPPKAERKRRN